MTFEVAVLLLAHKKKINGFLIVEILIVLIIIAVLVLAILPQYSAYTKKAKLQDIVRAAYSMKGFVGTCILTLGTTSGCNNGTNGIPAKYTGPASNLADITVTNGVITATAISNNGLNGETVILTPTLTQSRAIIWCSAGSADTSLNNTCNGPATPSSASNTQWSCSGNTCSVGTSTYTIWPHADTNIPFGSVDNLLSALVNHTGKEIYANTELGVDSGNQQYLGLSASSSALAVPVKSAMDNNYYIRVIINGVSYYSTNSSPSTDPNAMNVMWNTPITGWTTTQP